MYNGPKSSCSLSFFLQGEFFLQMNINLKFNYSQNIENGTFFG